MPLAKRPRAPGELTPKGEQTRQRIVAAAAQVMFDHSVSETTIEDVRTAAGVSSSQVYHYFKDKKALVQAVIEYQDQVIVGGQEPMLVTLDSLDSLRAWRNFLVAHQEELGCRGGCPIGSLGSADPDTLALAMLAALQGGLLLTQVQRSTRPLETALDAILALIAYETAPRAEALRPGAG